MFYIGLYMEKGLESDWIVGTERPSFSGSLILSMTVEAANPTEVSTICRFFRGFLFRCGLYDYKSRKAERASQHALYSSAELSLGF